MYNWKYMVKEFLLIFFGTLLMAISISVFYNPNNLVTGGVTGIGIIVEYISGVMGFTIPVWVTNAVLNVPLFIAGLSIFGFKRISKTLLATVLLTIDLGFTQYLPAMTGDLLLAALFGAVIGGLGLGLVFRCNATTGGTDMAAMIANTKIRHFSIARIMFFIDSAIVLLGFIVFGPIHVMYAIIAVFTTMNVINYVVDGVNISRAALIIADKPQEIAEAIMNEIDRGVTGLKGKGMYTSVEKDILLCVVSNKEIVLLKDVVKKIDDKAFVIVGDVRETLGEGFKSLK